MATAAAARSPAHLWIVGALALLYSGFSAYDYVMSHMRDLHYIAKSMPGVDPNSVLAWMDAFPAYAKIGWALGVWGALLGSILMLMRSRYAVFAFALSLIGVVLSFGYQLAAAPPLKGADGTASKFVPAIVIFVVGAALLGYSRYLARRGVLH